MFHSFHDKDQKALAEATSWKGGNMLDLLSFQLHRVYSNLWRRAKVSSLGDYKKFSFI